MWALKKDMKVFFPRIFDAHLTPDESAKTV